VQITLAESFGVEARGAFYDPAQRQPHPDAAP